MSKCTPAEIAEKKRIALERLKAKKTINMPGLKPNNATINTSPTILPAKGTVKFYGTNSSKNSINENRASTFLNTLKQSNVFTQRQEVRESLNPYKKPSTVQASNGPTQSKRHTNHAHNSSKSTIAPIFVKTTTCQIYMISATRFAVQPSNFHAKLIDIFKSIPNKFYDQKTKHWDFDIKDYDLIKQRVNVLNPEVTIGSIPKAVLNLCKSAERELDRTCLVSIEPKLADKLLPFQQDGVCFAISHNGRIMICDEMGLGKTYQALAVADFYRENWPLLICTTASTRETWANHIMELLPSISLHYIQVLTNNQQYIGDAKVLITSYNMMEKHLTKLLQRKFGFLIFDESHMLKNSKAKCTTVACQLAAQAKHVILLSGTPALSRPLELFTQLKMIDCKFMNFIDFTTRYCDGKQSNFGWDANGQSNLEELNVMLKLKFMLRRTKTDVLPELAEKHRETVILDPALVWSNESTKESLNTYAKNLSQCKGREKEEILLLFYAETAAVKARAVCSYLKTLVKEKFQFIVFAHHRVMMDAICDCLSKLNVKYIRIDGATRSDLRAQYVKSFQTNSSFKVAVLSLKACNAGITLTAAEMIIFAELDWNPSTLAQAESRAHRIGQNKPVTCRYLMATKTADDVIWNMLKSKQDVLNRAGLFCENLQEATLTTAPTISNKIEQYFSPNAKKTTPTMDAGIGNNNNNSTSREETENNFNDSTQDKYISKELENLDEFFMDDGDDDAVFKDLQF